MDAQAPFGPLGTPSQPQAGQPKHRQSVAIDARWIIVILLLVIGGMLAVWRPWDTNAPSSDDRTIRVGGEATVKAEPDQYVFYPSYQFKDADRATALDALTKKNTDLIDGLKKLGVKDAQIKTNASDYQSGGIYYGGRDDRSSEINYVLQLTITLTDKDLTQKVQDYLASTAPVGAVTPDSSFSTTKRKQLEDQARDEATKDARKKAEQSADNLGFKLGSVKTVSDSNGFDAYPMAVDLKAESAPASSAGSASSSLSVHPGENELNYSVSVEYYLR